jgi:hypothetical protein
MELYPVVVLAQGEALPVTAERHLDAKTRFFDIEERGQRQKMQLYPVIFLAQREALPVMVGKTLSTRRRDS